MKKINPYIIYFESELMQIGIFQKEYQFAKEKKRLFRFDYCFVDVQLAIEVEGGVWTGGRHTSSVGFIKDIEKYNLATELGFHLLRYEPKSLVKTATLNQIKKVYEDLRNERDFDLNVLGI